MKGVLILIGIFVVAGIMCGVVPFWLMPELGIGMALPVITVPGEVLYEDFLGLGFELTNTIVGTVIADILVLLFVFAATRNLKQVPGRLQGLFEVLTDALYGLAKSSAGANARKIFPLMATIFIFLLIANWVKLVPGAESIGIMHCAHEGLNGYEKDGAILKPDLDQMFDKGTRATHTNYELCKAKKEDKPVDEIEGLHAYIDPEAQAAVEQAASDVLGDGDFAFKGNVANEQEPIEYFQDEGLTADEIEGIALAAAQILEADTGPAADGADVDADAEGAEGDDAAADDADAAADDADHADDAAADDAEHADEDGAAAGVEGEDDGEHAEFHPTTPLERVELVLSEPFYRDNIYAVTPFVRGATTDLNLTLSLAILAVLAIQYFGVQALGISYFTKFLNTPALGNVDKNPMGIMDFVVGLLEIISELSKIISFAFRLFGTLFAGGVLLFVISFLTPMLVPSAVYVLELFVGLIQAFVFAMLTMVFSSMAMIPHHGDDHH